MVKFPEKDTRLDLDLAPNRVHEYDFSRENAMK